MSEWLIQNEISSLITSGLNYWVGEHPPFPGFISSLDIHSPEENFRLKSDLHGAFDAVFYVEHDLGTAKQWRPILDEMMRLVDGSGTLVLRFTPDLCFGVHELMNFIHAWTVGRAEVLFSRQWKNEPSRVLGITMNSPPRARDIDSVSFAVIVDGNYPDRLTRFVQSVASMDSLSTISYEILVCGPTGAADHIDHPDLRFLPQDTRFTDKGWITRKKNLLIHAARGSIIALSHDRYWYAPSFVVNLKAFGGDFDVLIPEQVTPTGVRYPSLVATSGRWDLRALAEYERGDYSPNLYVNGGILIARLDRLRSTPYNELLFWGEAEDVEHSRRLEQAGVTARHSKQVIVNTDLTRGDQISVFERMPYVSEYLSPKNDGPFYPIGRRIEFTERTDVREMHDMGLAIPRSWAAGTEGLTWGGADRPELAIRPRILDPARTRDWTITLGTLGGAPAEIELLVNGKRARMASLRIDGPVHVTSFDIPEDLVASGHSFLVQFAAGVDAQTRLNWIELNSSRSLVNLPAKIKFTSGPGGSPQVAQDGWGGREAWGMWSDGARCSIGIPIMRLGTKRDLIAHFDVQAFLQGSERQQRVILRAGDTPLELWQFTHTNAHIRTVRIPANSFGSWLDLSFEIAWPSSPFGQGMTEDKRLLGLGLRSVRLRYAVKGG